MISRSSLILAASFIATATPAVAQEPVRVSIPAHCLQDESIDASARFEPLFTDDKGRVCGVMSMKGAQSMLAVRGDKITCFVVVAAPTT